MNEQARRLYSAEQVRVLDRRVVEQEGISSYALMQRAAAAAWGGLGDRWPQARRIAVFCGPGNNGGDGYELARLAKAAGYRVRVFEVGGVPARGDAVSAHAAWSAEGSVEHWSGGDVPADTDVVVDAIFGIGLTRPPAGVAASAIAAINRAGIGVLAIDVPSGLDADTGHAPGEAVRATLTVCFVGRKLGLHTGQGPALSGAVRYLPLAAAGPAFDEPAPLAALTDAEELALWLPRRPRDAHKGDHGHVLLVGGEQGMAGAILLAARAALRAGAGLVTVATRAAHAALLTAAQPEAMFHAVESDDELRALFERADVVAIGPGLGQGEWGRRMWALASASGLPLVVDADALNLLAAAPLRLPGAILTPHPGEAARLLGTATAAVQADRAAAAALLYERYGASIVLKGAGSLVFGERLRVCPYGNPGMGAGGTGDVLTGIAAALLAQGLAPETAAAAAVTAHALAGDRAAEAGERGLVAGDLIAELRAVVNPADER